MNLFYAELIDLFVEEEMRMGRIKIGGAVKKVPLDLLTDAQSGDTLLLCDGVPISRVLSAGGAEKKDVSRDTG